jgi:hypothetical protein
MNENPMVETTDAEMEALALAACKRGDHSFVECDEWERTCIVCGAFEKE